MAKRIDAERRGFLKQALSTLALTGVASMTGRPARAAAPLKVGVLIPLSGPAGLFGPSAKNFTKMAVDEINARGGILGRKLEALFGDVGVAPAGATQTAMKMLLSDRVEVLIGMHDSAVRKAIIGAIRARVPYIYTPVYEGGECAKGVFVLGETPDQQLGPVIPWMASEKKIKSWYLIGNDYNWPRDSNKAAKRYIAKSGGKVVGEEYLPFTVDNFDSSLARIQKAKADGVLITLVGGASVTFNRAFASFGLAPKVYRLGTLIEENTLLGIGARSSKNLFSSAGYFGNVETTAAQSFAKKYYRKFGKKAPVINTLGQSVYEGFLFLEALAAKAGSLKVAAMDAASDGTSYTGPRGAVVMKDRHVSRDIYLAEAIGIEFRVVKSFANVGPGPNCA